MSLTKEQATATVERQIRSQLENLDQGVRIQGFSERDRLETIVNGALAALRPFDEALDELNHDDDDARLEGAWWEGDELRDGQE